MKVHDNLYAFLWQSVTINNCNTYLIDGPTRILIDPGHLNHFGHVQASLDKLGLSIENIGLVLCTHAHPDHIEALTLFKNTAALFAIHEMEWQLVKKMRKLINSPLQLNLGAITPDFFLKEGELDVNGLSFKIFHTPGHTRGSISIYWNELKALFTGDLIFKDGIGRTDLPGGDSSQLKASILKLSQLEAEYVLPGHGAILSGTRDVKANFDRIDTVWFGYL